MTIVPLTIRPAATIDDRAPQREFIELEGRGTASQAPPPSEPGWSLWAELEG
jgi:hypothetical protein